MNGPAKGTKDLFEKYLKSNAVGDEFVDPGQYFLRKPDRPNPKNAVNVGASVSHLSPFKYSGANQLVRHSEFKHHHNGPPPRPAVELKKNFVTRFTPDPFQKVIPYTEDLYETKEDLIKEDYVNRRN